MNKKFLLKLAIIGLLVLGLLIPLSMIEDLVSERSSFRQQAKDSIAQSWAGSQKVMGPVLVVPYSRQSVKKVWDKRLKDYVEERVREDYFHYVLPETLNISGLIKTEERKRGIYAVPVYNLDLKIDGTFSAEKVKQNLKGSDLSVDWEQAHLLVTVADMRGVVQQPSLVWQGQTREFISTNGLGGSGEGMKAYVLGLQLENLDALDFNFALDVQGMESVYFSPAAKNMQVDIEADWPHPSFVGRYLPAEHVIQDERFSAHWRVSSFSSGVDSALASCQSGDCGAFYRNLFGVELIQAVDIYLQAERSVKYAIMLITLTFTVFFLFEVMKSLRLHPMQYLLVGAALTVFYLLLVSLSEHIVFYQAYVIAACCSVTLVGVYMSAVLQSRLRACGVSALLLLLYGLLYGILQSEDNSLLMGSLLIFGVLSLVMMVTRKLDWYYVSDQIAHQAVLKK